MKRRHVVKTVGLVAVLLSAALFGGCDPDSKEGACGFPKIMSGSIPAKRIPNRYPFPVRPNGVPWLTRSPKGG